MLPQSSTRAVLESIQGDIETLHSLEEHLTTKNQELRHLEAALPILGQVLVQNQDIIKTADDNLAPLTTLLSCLSSATQSISCIPMRPNSFNTMLRMHSFPVLTQFDGIHGAASQTNLQIRMLRDMISESQEISSAAAVALETTHALIPTTKAAIERLKQMILDVGEDIKSKQRLVHPIHRLPCELVVQILVLAVQIEKEEQERCLLVQFKIQYVKPSFILRSITNVCRTWRANLRDDRFIWRTHLLSGSVKAFAANLARIKPNVLLIVENGDASLTSPDHDRYLSNLLLPPQVVHITFKSNVQLEILPFCPSSLHLYNRMRFDVVTLNQKFSSLQSLCCTDILPAINVKLLSLVDLKIKFRGNPRRSTIPLDSLSQTLSNTPNLTILDICCPMPGTEGTDPPILLASLTTLCLRLTFPNCLLTDFGTLLRCAKLTNIEISLPDEPAEKVEELLNVGQIRSQLTTLRILGPEPPQVEFARFPQLTKLDTLILEESCVHIFLEGLLCTRLTGEHPLICPVLSRLCIKRSTIIHGTIERAIHSYRQQRALREGGTLPKMSVEVYDCPNVSVTQMKALRRMRE